MPLFRSVLNWAPTVTQVTNDLINAEERHFDILSEVGLEREGFERLVLSVIQKESGGDPNAKADEPGGGAVDSYGLMQLHWSANDPFSIRKTIGWKYPKAEISGIRWISITDPTQLFDPFANIMIGTRYLLYQLNRLRDVESAILAYNAGDVKFTREGVPVNQKYLVAVADTFGLPLRTFTALTNVEKKKLL